MSSQQEFKFERPQDAQPHLPLRLTRWPFYTRPLSGKNVGTQEGSRVGEAVPRRIQGRLVS